MARLRGPRLADARRRRPGGIRRGVDVRGGARPGSRLARRRADRGARGQGHAPARRRPLRAAASRRHRAALPRQGRRPAGRVVHRLGHREPPGRPPRGRPRDRARAVGRSQQLQRAAGRAARDPDRARMCSASTCSSPTRSTTSSRESASPTTASTLSRGPVEQLRERTGGGPALEQDLSTPVGPGVVRASASSSPWLAPISSGPGRRGTPSSSGAVEVLGGHDERGTAGRPGARRRGSPSRPGWPPPPTAPACGSPTPRRPPCGRCTEADDGTLVVETARRDGPVRLRPPRRRRRRRHCSSTRSASPSCPTARSRSATPTTARSAATTRRPDEVSTLASGLAEPSDAVVERDPDSGETRLVVVESAAHRLTRVALPRGRAAGRRPGPPDPAAADAARPPAAIELEVTFVPPRGQKLDDRWGDPTMLDVSASPAELLLDGGGRAPGPAPDAHAGERHTGRARCTSRCRRRPATATRTPGRCPSTPPATCSSRTGASRVTLDEGAPGALTLDLRGA